MLTWANIVDSLDSQAESVTLYKVDSCDEVIKFNLASSVLRVNELAVVDKRVLKLLKGITVDGIDVVVSDGGATISLRELPSEVNEEFIDTIYLSSNPFSSWIIRSRWAAKNDSDA